MIVIHFAKFEWKKALVILRENCVNLHAGKTEHAAEYMINIQFFVGFWESSKV